MDTRRYPWGTTRRAFLSTSDLVGHYRRDKVERRRRLTRDRRRERKPVRQRRERNADANEGAERRKERVRVKGKKKILYKNRSRAWSPPPWMRYHGFRTWASFAPPLRVTAIWSKEPPIVRSPTDLTRSLLGFYACFHPSSSTAIPIPSRRHRLSVPRPAARGPRHQRGEVTVQNSFRDAVIGCTTSLTRSPACASYTRMRMRVWTRLDSAGPERLKESIVINDDGLSRFIMDRSWNCWISSWKLPIFAESKVNKSDYIFYNKIIFVTNVLMR